MSRRYIVFALIIGCAVPAAAAISHNLKPRASSGQKRLNDRDIKAFVTNKKFDRCGDGISEIFRSDGSYFRYDRVAPLVGRYQINSDRLCIEGGYCRKLFRSSAGTTPMISAVEYRNKYTLEFNMVPSAIGVYSCR